MASKNVLLGSGKPLEEEKVVEQIQLKAPAWRYHSSCPAGKIIRTDAEIDKLEAAGWVDHPGKVACLPGHEQLFDESAKRSKIDLSDAFKF